MAKQARQAMYYNKGARDLSPLEEDAVVRMRPFRLGQQVWEQATVTKRHDERSYEVETEKGTYRRNRADSLLLRCHSAYQQWVNIMNYS